MSLHEHTDDELKHKLSSGELGDKKTAMAEAVLRYRRNERGCRIGFKDTHHGEEFWSRLGLTAWVGLSAINKQWTPSPDPGGPNRTMGALIARLGPPPELHRCCRVKGE